MHACETTRSEAQRLLSCSVVNGALSIRFFRRRPRCLKLGLSRLSMAAFQHPDPHAPNTWQASGASAGRHGLLPLAIAQAPSPEGNGARARRYMLAPSAFAMSKCFCTTGSRRIDAKDFKSASLPDDASFLHQLEHGLVVASPGLSIYILVELGLPSSLVSLSISFWSLSSSAVGTVQALLLRQRS